MKNSSTRICTTHVGSLVRPPKLIELLRAKESGEAYDQNALDDRVRSSVVDVVRMQADSGIDIPSDGEYGKPNFAGYVNVSTHRIRVPTTQTQRAPDLKTGAVTEQSFWSFTKSTTVPAEAYAGRGLCYYYLGQHQKARLDWDRASSLDTNYRR